MCLPKRSPLRTLEPARLPLRRTLIAVTALGPLVSPAIPALAAEAVTPPAAASALFGSLILLPIYLQQVLPLDTLAVGLMLLPGGILMGVIAPVVGSLFDRYGPTPLVLPGMIVAAASLWGMATFDANTPIAWIVVVHVCLNLGFVFTPLLTSALGSLPRHLYSHGSAITSTIQQVAGAAGTALFVTLMSVASADALAGGADAVTATGHGIHAAFVLGAIVASAAVILALFVRRPADAEADAEPVQPHAH